MEGTALCAIARAPGAHRPATCPNRRGAPAGGGGAEHGVAAALVGGRDAGTPWPDRGALPPDCGMGAAGHGAAVRPADP